MRTDKVVARRTLRQRDALFPHGPGGIVDINGESFIAMDITEWKVEHLDELRCIPLQERLRVQTLFSPPLIDKSTGKGYGLPYRRFPRWRFCQDCGYMSDQVPKIKGISENVCQKCRAFMVPMRFVAVCETGGHLNDIPWVAWVHRKRQAENVPECKSKEHLYFRDVAGAGEGLNSVQVVCRACNSSRTLGTLSGSSGLSKDGFRCLGVQPWEYTTTECTSNLIAVQRGSTSLYKAVTVSALDIPLAVPEGSELEATVRKHNMFTALSALPDDIAKQVAATIAEDVGSTTEFVLSLTGSDAPVEKEAAISDLKAAEWTAFDNALRQQPDSVSNEFAVESGALPAIAAPDAPLADVVTSVGLVRRVRSVTSLLGFSRYRQDEDGKYVPVYLHERNRRSWLPAIEQFGEGILLRFSEERVHAWESEESVVRRVKTIARRAATADGSMPSAHLTPRFVMLHTFAHLLIRQLEFASGYSAASLSERIYADDQSDHPHAGVLILTSGGDSEGTLGGLVRQGEPDFLGKLLLRTIEAADWCANDPVCGESQGQGFMSLNLAACHNCALVSETSCEARNSRLDRRLLVDAEDGLGYFDQALRELRSKIA